MDNAYTIQISGNLVKQLADDTIKVEKKTKTRKPKPKPKPKLPQQTHLQNEDSETGPHHPPATWPPMYLPSAPPPANAEVDAIRSVVEDSEKVLEKLQKLEAEMAVEVSEKAKQLHEKEFKIPQPKPTPCLADLTACLDCYKENTKDPLKCRTLVTNYADCARTIRQQISSLS